MSMKTRLALAAVSAVTILASRADASDTVARFNVQGTQASTSFTSSASITCPDGSAGDVFAIGFISGSDSMLTQTGGPPFSSDGIFVEVDEYVNSCTGAFASGFGGIQGGYGAPNKALNSATLVGSTTFQDFNTGLTYPISIDLSIQASGPLTVTKAHQITRGTDPMVVSIDQGTFPSREGTVTGTITIDGVQLTSTFSTATIFGNGVSQITVTKN